MIYSTCPNQIRLVCGTLPLDPSPTTSGQVSVMAPATFWNCAWCQKLAANGKCCYKLGSRPTTWWKRELYIDSWQNCDKLWSSVRTVMASTSNHSHCRAFPPHIPQRRNFRWLPSSLCQYHLRHLSQHENARPGFLSRSRAWQGFGT